MRDTRAKEQFVGLGSEPWPIKKSFNIILSSKEKMWKSKIAGLSQPLTRLIEVISNGIGAVSRPYLIRRNADAKAYEVRTISSALKNIADQHHLPVVFKDGEFEIWQKPDDQTLTLQAPSNEDRANSRSNYQERKRQRNIENITSVAAADLLAQSSVPQTRNQMRTGYLGSSIQLKMCRLSRCKNCGGGYFLAK